MDKNPHPKIPIIDLHCDLLGCVENGKGKYDFTSPEMNCSVPQFVEGGVRLQVLAVAAITGRDSALIGENQVKLYQELLKRHSDVVAPFSKFSMDSPKVHFLLAIENASALLDEEEGLDLFFARFERYRAVEDILYVGLTWNQENRFGGGNLTNVGLKREGEAVLEFLDGTGIAIDLSHTSDRLAYDILNCIDKRFLKIPVMASHSNYRKVCPSERNLPEELAREVIRRKGVMGLNFVRRFVGKEEGSFIDQIEYALAIGGENSISLGADFYGGLDIPPHLCPGKTLVTFFENYANSGCYPHLIELLKGQFSSSLIEKICYKNVLQFLNQNRFNG